MQKKTILHFIYSLGRGGAETMLVKVLKELKEYKNIVVILVDENHFGSELECDKLICLNLKSITSIPQAVFKLKKIIRKERPSFVHSHLIWPSIIARLVTSRRIPLITTIHTSVASSFDYKRWHIRFFDKLTYKFRKSIIIVVAKVAYKEYFSILKLKPYKSFVLQTFVDTNCFNRHLKGKQESLSFKVISVGSLSLQKNFLYLINAFEKLKNKNIELHIYGRGDMEQQLHQRINEIGAKVILKGQVDNIQEIIPNYDLYIMPSLFEGFSLSVLEAMAMRMPLLLSDIPSFREQCEDCAIYFDLNNENDFIQKLEYLMDHKDVLLEKGEQAYNRVINNFTLEHL